MRREALTRLIADKRESTAAPADRRSASGIIDAFVANGHGVFDVGATGAAPGGSGNSVAIQRQLDRAAAAGGGIVAIRRPGLYLLNEVGNNPYFPGRRHCLDIAGDNIVFHIGPGVTLQLADGQQTDANGPVDLIVFEDRNNVAIVGTPGLSRITGNTAGQTGWSGGYAQIDNGCLILGDATSGVGNKDILIAGLQLDDHFSNPVNIDGFGETLVNERIYLYDLYGFDCGEGFQVIGARTVRCRGLVYEDPSDVAVGDGIELSVCEDFALDECEVRTNGAGSAFDLFGSKHGVLSNFLVYDWDGAFAAGTTAGGRIAEDIVVGPGVVRICRSNALEPPEGSITFHDIHVLDGLSTPFQIPGDATQPPVIFHGCQFIGNALAGDVRGSRGLILSGFLIDGSGSTGLSLIANQNNEAPLIAIDNGAILNSDTRGLFVNDQGFAYDLKGFIRHVVFDGNGTVPWQIGTGGGTNINYADFYVDLTVGTVADTLAGGNNNNYDPGKARILRLTADAGGSTITGLDDALRYMGRHLKIIAVAGGTLTIAHQSASSTAAHRIITPTAANLSLSTDDSVELIYDVATQRWRVVNFQQ